MSVKLFIAGLFVAAAVATTTASAIVADNKPQQRTATAPNGGRNKAFRYTTLSPSDIQKGADGKPLYDMLKHSSGGKKNGQPSDGQCVHPAPPRGWDSFDPFPIPVVFNEATLYQQAKLLADNYGSNTSGAYNYLIIDEGWAEIAIGQWMLDGYGRPIPNTFLFPSSATTGGFGPLVKTLEEQYGLQLGLWIIKGIPKMAVDMKLPIKGTSYTAADVAILDKPCVWHLDVYSVNMSHPAGQAYYDSLVDLYVREWGVKYIKIDCVFGTMDLSAAEAVGFSKAMNAVDPSAIVSLSPGGSWDNSLEPVAATSNLFRITNDVHDCWSLNFSRCILGTSIVASTLQLAAVEQFLDGAKSAPTVNDAKAPSAVEFPPSLKGNSATSTYTYGSFPDPDMVPLGLIRVGLPDAEISFVTRPNMARYIYGMWSITRSPIILGGEMASVVATDFVSSLYSNPYLTAMHQCSANPKVLMQQQQDEAGDHGIIVWSLQHGAIANSLYVGLFAFSNNPDATYTESVTLQQDDVMKRFAGSMDNVLYFQVIDTLTGNAIGGAVWRGENNGTFPSLTVPANDATLVTIIAFS